MTATLIAVSESNFFITYLQLFSQRFDVTHGLCQCGFRRSHRVKSKHYWFAETRLVEIHKFG